MQYVTANEHFRARFGCKVYKIGIDAGFTCPNRDGTLDTRGCIFCDAHGGSAFTNRGSVTEQIALAKAQVESKNRGGKYMAYFQSFTNTYAPVSVLRDLFFEAAQAEDVVAIAIGTRPDCLGADVLELLYELNQTLPVYVELGLQTIHESSVEYIRRGYKNDVYLQAVENLHKIGVHVITHLILGLPNETPEQMVESTRYAVNAGTDGIKFHLLHVLKDTDLEADYRAGKFECLTMETYADVLKQCVSVLPSHVVVHRLTGDGAKRDLVAPLWSADKKRVLNYINQILAK